MSRPDRPVDKFGFPIPVTFDEGPAPRKGFRLPESPGSRRALGVLVGVVIVGLLVGPWLVRKVKGLRAHMFEIRAENCFLDDDYAGAVENIDHAMQWLPENKNLVFYRAQYRLAAGDLDGALTDANTAVQQAEKFGRGYTLRSMIHHRRGEYAESIQDATAALKLASPNDPSGLNDRAYYRALAGQELPGALADVELALRQEPGEPSYLDTRGYIQFKLEKYPPALADFDKAIETTESQIGEVESQPVPRDQQKYLEREVRSMTEGLSVMYHHRAEVQDKLGHADKAKSDFAVAKKLGYDPSKGIE